MKTLKQKMNVIHYYELPNNGRYPVSMHEDQIEGCVQVARDFAVGFGKFLSENNTEEGNIEELLEIYETKEK
jgi:hypothetical protein